MNIHNLVSISVETKTRFETLILLYLLLPDANHPTHEKIKDKIRCITHYPTNLVNNIIYCEGQLKGMHSHSISSYGKTKSVDFIEYIGTIQKERII